MRVGILIAAVAAVLLGSPAAATPMYLFIETSRDGGHAIFVDLNSIQKSGQKVDYWMLQVNLAPTATKARYVSHILRRYTEDCAAHTSQLTYSVMYLGSGSPLSRTPITAAPAPVVPDTVGDEIQDVLCEGSPQTYGIAH